MRGRRDHFLGLVVAVTTTPQAPPQQPPPPPAQQQIALALLIAPVLVDAVNVDQAMFMLQQTMSAADAANIADLAIRGALAVAMSLPPDRLGAAGPASLAMIRANTLRRAQFVVASAMRLTRDIREARSRGTSVASALAGGITRERRYFGQHVAAMWTRAQAGAKVDSAAGLYGPLLGWHTVRDARTSPDCLAADRHNFWADAVPLIGYPGAVHPHCRCEPSKPYPGARILPSAGARRLARDGRPSLAAAPVFG